MRLSAKHIRIAGKTAVVEIMDLETGRSHVSSYKPLNKSSIRRCVSENMYILLKDIHGEDYEKKVQDYGSDYLGQIERVTDSLFSEIRH